MMADIFQIKRGRFLFIPIIGLAFLVTAASSLKQVHAQDGLKVNWEVANRFAPFEVLRKIGTNEPEGIKVFDEWSFKPGESVKDWHKRMWAEGAGPLANGSPYAEHLGKENLHWNADKEEHHPSILKYVKEENSAETKISVRLWSNYDGPCTWSGANLELKENYTNSCRDKIIARIPLTGTKVTFTYDGGSELGNISPVHMVIVGFGGSYGSGEGNPDRPTKWRDFIPPANTVGWLHDIDNYEKNGKAAWLDDDCHRSFFSQQTLTALALASENKHRFVSFLHYACTGAEIFSGHLAPHLDPGHSRGYSKYSQVNAAVRDLLSSGCECRFYPPQMCRMKNPHL